MTDNRTTELLRKLLDERGLNCQTHYLHVFWYVGPKLYEAKDNLDGTLTVDNLTPEQAIAATLGSGAMSKRKAYISMPRHNGERYAKLMVNQFKQMNATLGNAKLGSGTCEIECFDDGVDEGLDGEWFSYSPPTWYLSCGHTAQGTEKPNFCPSCGKAVKR